MKANKGEQTKGTPHVKGQVAVITDRRTNQKVPVIPKKGESAAHAIERVTKRHQ